MPANFHLLKQTAKSESSSAVCPTIELGNFEYALHVVVVVVVVVAVVVVVVVAVVVVDSS